MDKILIFIPMYNCEKQIPRVISRIAALKEKQRYFSQVLIVDNRSRDGSVEAAQKALTNLDIPAKLVQNRENYSLGGSHKVAFSYAIEEDFDYVVVLHGDDQGDISDLLPVLEEGRCCQYDSMLGSRFSKGSRLLGYSRFRIFGNHVFNAFLSLCTGRRIYDLGSGLNLYKVSYLASRFYMPFANDLSFNVFLLLYGIYAKSRFCFFPLSWREEDQVSNAKLLKQVRRMLGLAAQYVFCRKKVFSPRENAYSTMDYSFHLMAEHLPGEGGSDE